MSEPIRTFDTGATRSPLGNKLQHAGFHSPLVFKCFSEYMHKHRTQSDGTVRDADNWQKGIPDASLVDSLSRHYVDVWLHQRGYHKVADEPIIDALCGILFNTNAYLHQILIAEHVKIEENHGQNINTKR